MSNNFLKYYNLILRSLNEDNVSAPGGVFGTGATLNLPSDSLTTTDSYASGDARIPVVIGKTTDKKKKNKLKSNPTKTPIFRRNLENDI